MGLVITVVLLLIGVCVFGLVYGIHVLANKLFGGTRKRCPRCNAPLTHDRCGSCLWPDRQQIPSNLVEAELCRYLQNGWITSDDFNHVVAAIEIDRQGLRPVLPVASPFAAAPPPPPTPPGPMELSGDLLKKRQGLAGAMHPPPLPHTAPTAPAAPAPKPAPAPVSPPQPVAPAIPVAVVEPRKHVSQMLASFMETGNIRWGELVGGLLIIGCSVALVISLWSQIAHQPILKFLVFNLVTAGLFGLGFYSHHRWKLPLTSFGILITATLMVPLAFLASTAFSEGAGSGNIAAIAGQVISLAVFATLVWFGARVIAMHWPALLTAVVMGSAIFLLIVRYMIPGSTAVSDAHLLMLAALPLACYQTVVGLALRRAHGWKQFTYDQCHTILLLLGIGSFATLLPLALLVHKAGATLATFATLAPLISFAGLPALAVGLLLWRRLETQALGAVRTTGTAVAVVGAGLLLAGIFFSWPAPGPMLLTALLDCAVLAVIALVYEIPAANLPAGLCLTWAYLIGLHLAMGTISWTAGSEQIAHALLAGTTAVGLAPRFIVVFILGEWLYRMGRSEAGRFVAYVAVLCAGASLLGITRNAYFNSTVDQTAAGLYALYAISAMAGAWRFKEPKATWVGWALLAAAVWILPANQKHPLALALLVDASLAAGMLMASRLVISNLKFQISDGPHPSEPAGTPPVGAHSSPHRAWEEWPSVFDFSSRCVALAGSLLAICPLWLQMSLPACDLTAGYLLWIGLIWGAVSLLEAWPVGFVVFQGVLSGAALLLVTGRLARQDWFARVSYPWCDPRTIQAYAIAAGILGMIWGTLRHYLKQARWQAILQRAWIMDLIVSGAAMICLYVLAIAGIAPGIGAEFSESPVHLAASAFWGSWASWLLLAILAARLLLEMWHDPAALWLQVLAVLLFAACPLWAVRWQEQNAVASALRWAAAVYLLLGAIPIWARTRLGPMVSRFGEGAVLAAGQMLLRIGVVVILVLTLYASCLQPRGPVAHSFFGSMGNSVSYLVPLVVVIATLVGYGIRERSARYAFDGGLVVNMAATLAHLLGQTGSMSDSDLAVQLLQTNITACAGYALGWLAVRQLLWRESSGRTAIPALLALHIWLAISGVFALAIIIDLHCFAAAGQVLSPDSLAGSMGLLAALLTGVACIAWRKSEDRPITMNMAALALLVMAGMSATLMQQLGGDGWAVYHTFMVCHAAAAWAVLALSKLVFERNQPAVIAAAATSPPAAPQSPAVVLDYQSPLDPVASQRMHAAERMRVAPWLMGIAAAVVFMALRVVFTDPQRPWWPAETIFAMSILAAAAACWRVERNYLYNAGTLFNLAASIGWMHFYWSWTMASLVDLLSVNVVALALPGIACLVLDLKIFRPREPVATPRHLYHGWAAMVSLVAVLVIVMLGLNQDVTRHPLPSTLWLAWVAWASTGALLIACLWDGEMSGTLAALYFAGLAGAGLLISQFHLSGYNMAWLGAVVLAAYGLATSYLFSIRAYLARWITSNRGTSQTAAWLIPANLALAALVMVLGFWADFALSEFPLRLLVATAVISQAFSIGLPAGDQPQHRQRYAALSVAVIAAVLWAWAWQSPDELPLNRLVLLLTVLIGMSAFYAAGLAKFLPASSRWAQSTRRFLPALFGLALVALLVTLGCEVAQHLESGEVLIAMPASVAVSSALVLGMIAAVVMAVVPGRDPLRLSPRGRAAYIYAAEILLALMFLHLRLTAPWLFTGFLEGYWPLLILAISFGGVGLGELFRRQQMVPAEPLQRTAAFLPLLPALAFWTMRSNVDYSTVLVLAGLLYATLAVLRRSFAFGLMAALSANGALWHLLNETDGLGFLQHPQFWLIPAALSVLVAAYLNRDRLSQGQLQTIHHCCLLMIYVSSTADMFRNGIARSPGLLWILGALSIAGALAGIMFRIRSFVFQGTAFLVLTLITFIWYASVDLHQTWLIWASGIALGLGIILLFALFEKKRAEILAAVDKLKEWQG